MYSNEKSAQLIVALLKKHGIKNIIASPGTTNFGIVGSMQQDYYFRIVSSVDERSAAYMACGLASTLGEPVVLSCTGATASREYLAGLTEAYYRKLPVVAITSFNGTYNVGQLMPQNIDRRVSQDDIKVFSIDLPLPISGEDERYFVRKVNEALLACRRHGGGPVHINVPCDYERGAFTTEELPNCRVYRRYMPGDILPSMDTYDKIAVFIGAHLPFKSDELNAIEHFATTRNVVIMTDHTSNYRGARSSLTALAAENSGRWSEAFRKLIPDLIIDLGEVSGDYVTTGFLKKAHVPVWRVSDDGELRDRFNSLTNVFEMRVEEFFSCYAREGESTDGYWRAWEFRRREMEEEIPELGFTNRWISKTIAPLLKPGSILHMAILNSLRSWNYWEIDSSIDGYCNTGGFGIDGAISTAIGSALANSNRMNYLFCGDLAFFYDLNALGNRYLPKNLRILMVNNGMGVEFKMPYSPASVLHDDVDPYIAAEGHFTNQYPVSRNEGTPAKAWCESLGIKYLQANDYTSFQSCIDEFIIGESRSPVVLECFVNPNDEVAAANALATLDCEAARRQKIVDTAKEVLPSGVFSVAKKIISR